MQWHEWIAFLPFALTCVGVYLAPALGRRAGKKELAAAVSQADEELKKAVAIEKEAAAKEWVIVTEGMQKWNESLASRLGEVENRLSTAEIRSSAADIKASAAEKNYRIAIAYLRRVMMWVNDNWPGNDCPDPPPELRGDL